MSQSSNFLVVSGNVFDRNSLVTALQGIYRTQVVGMDSSNDCLEYLHRTKQSVVVVLDVEGPLAKKGLFGVALIKNISTDLNLGHVAVVATAKTANEQLMISSIESGAVDHLVFPLSIQVMKSLWLNAIKKQKIRALESMKSSQSLVIDTNHTPINSWEYQNVIQLMNQYCSPLVDINLSAFPKVDGKDPAMLTKVQSWAFDAFALTEDELFAAIVSIFNDLQVFTQFDLDLDCFHRFLLAVRANYRNNPYHNFRHAVDVLQSFYYLLVTSTILGHLKHLEILALAVASLCHDLAHPGLNNFYHVNARTPLALLYNNKSVLENFHATATFCVLMRPEFNFISSFNQTDYKSFRDVVISSIMATDMAVHFDFINDMKRKYEEVGSFTLEKKDDVKMLATSLVKCSDISNVTRPFDICTKWAEVLMDEFQAQGRLEKSSNLPIYPFGKEDLVLPVSQKEFISFVALPLFDLMAKLSDAFAPLLQQLRTNLNTWTAKIVEERPSTPDSPIPAQHTDPKRQKSISGRRKSLPAAQFLLRNPPEPRQHDSTEEEPEEPDNEHESEVDTPLTATEVEPLRTNGRPRSSSKHGKKLINKHVRSASQSGLQFYQSEDEHEETSWQPPVERVSAIKILDGGAETIFKQRNHSHSDSTDSF